MIEALDSSMPLNTVIDVLNGNGYQAYAVGGCVRDALLNMHPKDIDVATEATPEQAKAAFEVECIRTIDTGIQHGTVTAVVAETLIEVTTFRADSVCDGRHAEVKYVRSLSEDAKRRDFTINSLYYAPGGGVIDPTGTGVSDLYQGAVRFVGSPRQRIREDYLRILRFFRFNVRFGRIRPDKSVLKIIKEYVPEMVERVSEERMFSEIYKILEAEDPVVSVVCMDMVGIWKTMFGIGNMSEFLATFRREIAYGVPPSFVTRYLALTGLDHIPLRGVSNAENKAVKSAYLAEIALFLGASLERVAHEYGIDAAMRACLWKGHRWDDARARWGEKATFPVTAADVMAAYGLEPSKAVGDALSGLRELWYEDGMTQGKEELIERFRCVSQNQR